MAKKEQKRLSINTVEKVMKDTSEASDLGSLEEIIDWHGCEVHVKKIISFDDAVEFINDVVKSSYDENGEYRHELKQIAIFRNTLTKYANFPNDAKLEFWFDLMSKTLVMNTITDHIHYGQYHSIIAAAESKVDLINNSNIKAIERDASLAVQKIEELASGMNEMMSGVDANDVSMFIQNMANSESFNDYVTNVYANVKGMGM